jgi:hypothetical protein
MPGIEGVESRHTSPISVVERPGADRHLLCQVWRGREWKNLLCQVLRGWESKNLL